MSELLNLSVAEFAKESEDNKLMQAHIWTKAYQLESRVKELQAEKETYRQALEKIAETEKTSGFLNTTWLYNFIREVLK